MFSSCLFCYMNENNFLLLSYLLLYFPVTYKACNSCDLFSNHPPPPPRPTYFFIFRRLKTSLNAFFMNNTFMSNIRLRFNPNKAISCLLVKAVTSGQPQNFDLFYWKAQSFNLIKHQKIHVNRIFLFPIRFKI